MPRPLEPAARAGYFGFDALHRAGYRGQGMRIALFELGAGWVPGDLAAFGRCFGMPTPRVRGIPVGADSVPSPLASDATVEYARAKGSPPIGFANPLLCDLGGDRSPALRDAVQGDNDILGIGCCGAGPGHDTATGWGSVNVTRFAQAAHRA